MGWRSKGYPGVHRYCLGEARGGKTKPWLPIGYMSVRGACHKFFSFSRKILESTTSTEGVCVSTIFP